MVMNINIDGLRGLLLDVEKPSRYTGGEFGAPDVRESAFNFCICLDRKSVV